MVVESSGITYINLGGGIEKERKGEKGGKKREWDEEGEKGWNRRNLCIWAISAAEIDSDVMYYKHVHAASCFRHLRRCENYAKNCDEYAHVSVARVH